MKLLTIMILALSSLSLSAATPSVECYLELRDSVARNRAAIICNGLESKEQLKTVKKCYQSLTDQKVGKTNAAVLCNRVQSEDQISLLKSCYQQFNSTISFQRAAFLCNGIKSKQQMKEIKKCYKNLENEVSRERAAVLCAPSALSVLGLL